MKTRSATAKENRKNSEKRVERASRKKKPVGLDEYNSRLARRQERRIEAARKLVVERSKMTDYIKTVKSLCMDGNLSENWRKFQRNWNIFAAAINLDAKTELVKVSTFLNAVGPDAVEVFDTFALNEVQRATCNDVIQAFQNFCTPRKNTVYERYVFYQRNQREGETFDAFLIDIKRLVRTCEFGQAENEMLRDRIVMGITDKKLQARLLETADLTYDTAVTKARASEATKEQTTKMNQTATVDALYKAKNESRTQNTQNSQNERKTNNNNENGQAKQNSKKENRQNNNAQSNHTQSNGAQASGYSNNNRRPCKYCSYHHRPRECPAYGKECTQCKKLNHFRSVCKSRSISTIETVNYSDDELNFDNEEFYIGLVEKTQRKNLNKHETHNEFVRTWFERVFVDGDSISFKIDTGAQMNVLPWSVVRRINPNILLKRTNITLMAFGGQRIQPLGMCTLDCRYKNENKTLLFAVVDFDIVPILGLESSAKFKIVNPPRANEDGMPHGKSL